MKFASTVRSLTALFCIAFTLSTFSQTDIEVLEQSPRHQEWVKLENNGRILENFVVYPEASEKAKVLIIIHDSQGLNDWVRRFADELAAKGFIAITPDLLSSTSEATSKTTGLNQSDVARKAIYSLDAKQIKSDLDTLFDYAKSIPAGTGEVSVMGFCWGGTQSFEYATSNPELEKAIVFYGIAPKDEKSLATIKVPVYGFYGGNDARVNFTIPKTEMQMNELGKFYSYTIYDGGGGWLYEKWSPARGLSRK